ncbi:Flp pilus assembly protein TadB [Crossiella equi]|uniref:Flp pilus assembly protein TadB n=1 Tax=Crossiella equi TaxID=130796 RepID=A0ABS5AGA7_9PSEU|nr:type II secretion system F family protein [Crossiella equi]MBP2475254.1 Flp pilus assembly protein TadB [Crossiella equi]
MSAAVLLLALAVLVWPTRPDPRLRLGLGKTRRWKPSVLPVVVGLTTAVAALHGIHPVLAGVVAVLLALGAHVLPGRTVIPPSDPLDLAAAWDLLAACLRSGLAVPAALGLAAGELPAHLAKPLVEVARLLVLGAGPVEAWAPAEGVVGLRRLARAARHTARSGAALAETAAGLAARLRGAVEHEAEARAQRAVVLSTAPLGLCFLPAFLCLGVAPMVLGLADTLFLDWERP